MLKKLRHHSSHRRQLRDPQRKLDVLFFGVELGGETGEALNKLKKIVREELGIAGSRATVAELAEELADVIICCDLVAQFYAIDLEKAIRLKFNKTSHELNLPVLIP